MVYAYGVVGLTVITIAIAIDL